MSTVLNWQRGSATFERAVDVASSPRLPAVIVRRVIIAIGFFLAIRRGRWWTAALLGALAALSRPVGMTLALPALIEAARLLRGAPWRSLVARAAAIFGPVVGGGAFLAWSQHVHHDWLHRDPPGKKRPQTTSP